MSLDYELAIEQEIFAFHDKSPPSYVCSPEPYLIIETRNDFGQWGYLREHESFCAASRDDFLNKCFQGRPHHGPSTRLCPMLSSYALLQTFRLRDELPHPTLVFFVSRVDRYRTQQTNSYGHNPLGLCLSVYVWNAWNSCMIHPLHPFHLFHPFACA